MGRRLSAGSRQRPRLLSPDGKEEIASVAQQLAGLPRKPNSAVALVTDMVSVTATQPARTDRSLPAGRRDAEKPATRPWEAFGIKDDLWDPPEPFASLRGRRRSCGRIGGTHRCARLGNRPTRSNSLAGDRKPEDPVRPAIEPRSAAPCSATAKGRTSRPPPIAPPLVRHAGGKLCRG